MIVGARSGPSLGARAVHRYRTVGRIQSGNKELFFFVALCGLKLDRVPTLLDVRNCDSETSLVGVLLEGSAREAGEPSPFDLGVPKPLALGRPTNEVVGKILSRWV